MRGDHATCENCPLFLCLVPEACTCEVKLPAKETADGVRLCERCWDEAFGGET